MSACLLSLVCKSDFFLMSDVYCLLFLYFSLGQLLGLTKQADPKTKLHLARSHNSHPKHFQPYPKVTNFNLLHAKLM